MKKIKPKNNILPYNIQSVSTSHDAFSILMIGQIKKNHTTLKTNPQITMNKVSIEKYFFANGRFFSPKVFEIKALHPFPTIKPKEAIIIKTGNVRFTAVKASFQTKLETKTQSTTQ